MPATGPEKAHGLSGLKKLPQMMPPMQKPPVKR